MRFAQSFLPLEKSKFHTKQFDCGRPAMNQFLSRFALKHAQLGLSRTLVLPALEDRTEPARIPSEKAQPENSKQAKYLQPIAAYYTLASTSVSKKDLSCQQSLPHYSIPAILLARLAVDIQYQGRNIGEKSLIYALRHAVRLSDQGLPAFCVILDVLDQEALNFYQQFDFFHCLSNNPMRLFVPMKVLRKI